VHYNTYLGYYIMLLNRSHDDGDGNWSLTDGIYMSYTACLDQPWTWSQPELIHVDLPFPRDYVQVIGTGPSDTDKVAGQSARLISHGRSDYLIAFGKR
jgi:hypothetical protein